VVRATALRTRGRLASSCSCHRPTTGYAFGIDAAIERGLFAQGDNNMTAAVWWVLVGAALVSGAAAGGWFAYGMARTRYASRLRRATEELHQRHAATVEQMRTAQARAQSELEQTRNSFKRQLAVVAAEPRAAAARAEERLRAAYDELDRLRRAGAPPDTGTSELADGFAATRPMREGM
jgi:hypothetical protein